MDNSVSQTPAAPILEPDKHRQLPWLAVVLSLLVLSVIGALAFQNLKLKKQLSSIAPPPAGGSQITPKLSPSASPSQMDTSDWKTYINDKLNFQFKYPSTLFVNQFPEYTFTVFLSTKNYALDKLPNEGPFGPISLGLNECINTTTNKVYVCDKTANDITKKLKELTEDYKEIEILVGGKRAIQVTGNMNIGGGYYKETIISLTEPYILEISYYSMSKRGIPKKEYQYYEDIYDLILSTFQFIDPFCAACPQIAPSAPNFCADGTIIPGQVDACGCQLPPTCKTN